MGHANIEETAVWVRQSKDPLLYVHMVLTLVFSVLTYSFSKRHVLGRSADDSKFLKLLTPASGLSQPIPRTWCYRQIVVYRSYQGTRLQTNRGDIHCGSRCVAGVARAPTRWPTGIPLTVAR